jgi:LysM repeat protein
MKKEDTMKYKLHGFGTIIISIILLILLIISIYRTFYSTQTVAAQSTDTYQTYIVKPGDTYWHIASLYVNGDPRKFIYDIEKLNSIPADDLRPGQSL